MNKTLLLLSGWMLMASSVSAQFNQVPITDAPKSEFRSIWLTTAFAADWPKSTNVVEQQRSLREKIAIQAEYGMNAIVFQVTSRGDVQYRSERMPWSRYLTGSFGGNPGWDPLQFVIEEAKKYGMEVHAWYNVFNVGVASDTTAYKNSFPLHVFAHKREWVSFFGNTNNEIWLNPGISEARSWAVENVKEIVENYDIDAIHFDFARYPSAFPGDTQRYQENNNGFNNISDWRRNNVNQFQRDAYAAVQEIKPWVKVGTSPFGHYQRSSYSSFPAEPCPLAYNGRCSWDAALAYSQVFQDAVAWINEGVNDYIAPQIYWNIGPGGVSTSTNPHFEFLTRDWRRLSLQSGKHVYIGIGAYQNSIANNVAAEIATQVDTIRVNGHHGHMFFRFDHTIYAGPPDFRTLRSKIDYQHRAFVPVMDWKDMDVPPAVEITREMPVASILDNSITVTWDAPDFETTSGDTKVSYAVYRVAAFNEPDPTTVIMDPANLLALTGETSYTDLPDNTEGENYYYFVTPYSRNWVEGAPSNVLEFFTPTSIESGDQLASQFKLEQNYPNPFNPSTQIRFTLGEATHATLTVYDIMGREVATLVDQPMAAGSHRVQFNASELSSGLYVYSLRAGSFIQTNKMMLIK